MTNLLLFWYKNERLSQGIGIPCYGDVLQEKRLPVAIRSSPNSSRLYGTNSKLKNHDYTCVTGTSSFLSPLCHLTPSSRITLHSSKSLTGGLQCEGYLSPFFSHSYNFYRTLANPSPFIIRTMSVVSFIFSASPLCPPVLMGYSLDMLPAKQYEKVILTFPPSPFHPRLPSIV